MKKTLILALSLALTGATFAQTDAKPATMNKDAKSTMPAPTAGKPAPAPAHPNHPAPDMEMRAKQATDQMNAVVILSKDQYPKVMEANMKFQKAKMTLLKGESKKEMTEDQKTQLKALKADRKKEVTAILTPEQQKKWQDHNHANHPNHANGKDNMGKPGMDHPENEDEK